MSVEKIRLHVFHAIKLNGIINLACATCVSYANSIHNHCSHIMNLELKGDNTHDKHKFAKIAHTQNWLDYYIVKV